MSPHVQTLFAKVLAQLPEASLEARLSLSLLEVHMRKLEVLASSTEKLALERKEELGRLQAEFDYVLLGKPRPATLSVVDGGL